MRFGSGLVRSAVCRLRIEFHYERKLAKKQKCVTKRTGVHLNINVFCVFREGEMNLQCCHLNYKLYGTPNGQNSSTPVTTATELSRTHKHTNI